MWVHFTTIKGEYLIREGWASTVKRAKVLVRPKRQTIS
jgi:hypothetical protein